MAVPTVTTLVSNRNRVVVRMVFTSAGSDNLTNFVVYNSATQHAALQEPGGVPTTDPLNCKVRKVIYSNNSAAGIIAVNFDATTPVPVVAIPKSHAAELDFCKQGGLVNSAGTGKTGNVTVTTTGIASGETIEIVLDVNPL